MFTLEKGWHLKDAQDKQESRIETWELSHLVSHLLITKTERTKDKKRFLDLRNKMEKTLHLISSAKGFRVRPLHKHVIVLQIETN